MDKILNEMWEALKNTNCVHPPSAVRVSMLTKEGFKKAMKPFAERLADLSKIESVMDFDDLVTILESEE